MKYFIINLNDSVECIDVALLNVGLAPPAYSRSEYGWEMTVQVNVLSTALMALLLLSKLRAMAAARGLLVYLTFVNSITYIDVRWEWFTNQTLLITVNDESRFDLKKTYAMGKLLGIATIQGVVDAVAKGPQGDSIVVNACYPSLCKTDLGRDFGIVMRVLLMCMRALLARTAEQGARTLVGATALGMESRGLFLVV